MLAVCLVGSAQCRRAGPDKLVTYSVCSPFPRHTTSMMDRCTSTRTGSESPVSMGKHDHKLR